MTDIAKETTTVLLYHSTISPLPLSKLSDSSFLKVLIWSNEFGNLDDDCSNDNAGLSEEEAEAAISIAFFVNASTMFF